MGVCYLCEFIEMNFKFFYFIFYLNYIFICNDLSSFFFGFIIFKCRKRNNGFISNYNFVFYILYWGGWMFDKL